MQEHAFLARFLFDDSHFVDSMIEPDSIPTRQSLLVRLKDWGDESSWREFFDTYWRLIHATARKAGLTETEAEETVQEVMIAVAKKMPEFTYDPVKDSLKGWLLSVTRWKIADQFRKRQKLEKEGSADPTGAPSTDHFSDETRRTSTVERIPDPNADPLELIWDAEWRENLLRSALDQVKRRVNPAHYEAYHLNVIQGLSARATATALGVSVAAVHLAKHRVGRMVEAEVRRFGVKSK